jgi:hypothetical protein
MTTTTMEEYLKEHLLGKVFIHIDTSRDTWPLVYQVIGWTEKAVTTSVSVKYIYVRRIEVVNGRINRDDIKDIGPHSVVKYCGKEIFWMRNTNVKHLYQSMGTHCFPNRFSLCTESDLDRNYQ